MFTINSIYARNDRKNLMLIATQKIIYLMLTLTSGGPNVSKLIILN